MSTTVSAWATARVRHVEAREQEVAGLTVTAPAETLVVAGDYPEDMPDVLVRVAVAIDEQGNDRSGEVAGLIVAALHQAAEDADAEALAMETRPSRWVPCSRCEGCRQVANSDDAEPWTAWEGLPPGSDMAVRLGLVRPVPCPVCEGVGEVRKP